MTKYEEIKNMSIDEMEKEITDKITSEVERITNYYVPGIEARIKEWLNKGIAPTISDAERVILESIDKDYKWIARDKEGDLFVYTGKPYRHGAGWDSTKDYLGAILFNHLFQFIKWGEMHNRIISMNY